MSPEYAVEALKLRRSRIVLVATLALALVPSAMARGFLAAVEQGGDDPASLKAQATLPGVGWTGYLGGLMQIYATAGLIGVGIVVGWCFGREYADRTVVSLYASATPREAVAKAKLVLLTLWATAIGLAAVLVTLLIGLVSGLGMPDDGDWQTAWRMTSMVVLSGLLALPVAMVASVGRGYLPAVGGLLILVVLAQVATIAGAGGWWPWSVPAVWAMGPEAGMPAVAATRLLLVPAVALAGAVATVRWWRHAEVV
jgi:ABC-2 type transport system permease protein